MSAVPSAERFGDETHWWTVRAARLFRTRARLIITHCGRGLLRSIPTIAPCIGARSVSQSSAFGMR